MSRGSDWYCEEATLLHAVQVSGWSPPAEPGIPGYDDWHELRRGGQGIVYSAAQQSTRRRVAVKILAAGPIASHAQRHRFEREIDVIAGFQHPHIVRLYDRGLTSLGLPFYVMELIDGCSLGEHLGLEAPAGEKGGDNSGSAPGRDTAPGGASAPPLGDTLHLLAKICEGVAYAHQRGIVHRDLKPGNILVDSAGEPHVVDFGLARSILADACGSSSILSRTGDFLGTLPWASPEQAEGVPERVDARSDVYSLGVILFQALTGRLPYPVGSLPEVLESIRHVDPPRPSTLRRGLGGELDAIVLKCLAKEPARRYPDAGALAADLACYLRGEPVAARRDTLAYRLSKRFRRHRATAVLSAALIVLGGLAIGVALAWSHAERVRHFGVEVRPDGLIVVDTAVLGQNVPGDLRAGSTLRVNTLRDLSAKVQLPGSLDLGHSGGDGRGFHIVGAGQQLVVAETLRVGASAPGALQVLDGGTVRSASGFLGHEIGARGRVTIRGQSSAWECGNLLCVGNLGPGQLTLSEGGQMSTRVLRVGDNARGAMGVDGTGSEVKANAVVIGAAVEGELEVSGGGRVGTEATDLGLARGARGTLRVNGPGSTFDNHGEGDFYVGHSGEGSLWVEDGAGVSARNMLVGGESTACGRVVVTGAATRLHCRRLIYVGCSGQGSLEIRDAATCNGPGVVGWKRGSIGSVLVTGGATAWDVHAACVAVGCQGSGTLHVREGATLSCGIGSLSTGLAGSDFCPDALAEVVVSDAGSSWTTRYLYVGGSRDGNGGAAGLRIEQGGAVAVADLLRLHPRGQIVLNVGHLAADTLDNTRGGALMLDGGEFHVGTCLGRLVNTGAVVSSLRPPGLLSVSDDYVQEGGTLRVRVFGAAAGQFDRVEVGGAAQLGGRLEILLCDGFSPAVNDRLEVLAAAEVEGAFDAATTRCELVGGGSCEVIYADAAVILTDFQGPCVSAPYVEDPLVARIPRWEPPTSGPYPGRLSRNTTGESDRLFLGAPDGFGLGLGGQVVDFDFADQTVVDGSGVDIVVYEVPGGGPEYEWMDVLVSADGAHFVSVKASEAPPVRIPGAEQHPFALGYDLVGSGLSAVRYVRIDGRGDGRAGSLELFDLDAIGAVHFTVAQPAVP